jgi:hypothetical protein
MNKNTRRKVEAVRDARGRIKHGRCSPVDQVLCPDANPPQDSKPKVGRSGKEIARHLWGPSGRPETNEFHSR